MADEAERLIVAVEARIRDFEKNMAKASRTAGDEFTKIERRAKQSGDRLEGTMKQAAARVGGVLKNFAAGFVGGIAAGGVIGIVGQLGQVAAGIAEIGDQAKRAGVTSTAFQEWATVAQQARIPVDSLVDGLKELQLRGDEFAVTGKGSAAEAFGRLGYGAEELKRKLADPSALLLEIIERLGKFDRAAQIRIADEVFGGTAGERFVELLDRGADSIRATINEAHALGNILDDEVITRAAEVDRQFKIVSQTVGVALKSAIIDAVSALQRFIDSFRAFEDQQTASLETQYEQIGLKRIEIENKILAIKQEQRDLDAGLTDTAKELGFGSGSAVENKRVADLEAEQKALSDTEAQILAVLEARRKLRETPSGSPASTFTPPAYTPPPATGGGAKRDASAAAAEREAKAVRALIGELERELSLIGATDLERRISNELRNAGAAATDDQRARIVALISAIESETLAQERGTQAKQEFANIATGAITGFINDLRNGATVGQAFASTLNRIIDRLVDMAVQLLIIGPLLKMFGFSGGGIVPGAGKVQKLATGGYVSGPGSATSDSIPARLSNGEFVVNAAATAKHRALLEAVNDNRLPALATGGMAGQGIAPPAAIGGQVISINAPITVNGSAGTPEQNTDLAKRMAREMEATMRHVITDEMRKQTRPGNFFGR